MNISQLREKYPQYNDLSDEALAKGFHKKYYSDMDFDTFATKIGYKASKERQGPTTGWVASNPNIHGLYGAAKAVYETVGKPVIEGLGMVGGGVIGAAGGTAAAGPGVGTAAGAVVGAGLGYAQAKKINEIASRWLKQLEGMPLEDKTLKQELTGSLRDVQTGVMLEMGGQGLAKIATVGVGKIIAPYAKRMTLERQYSRAQARKYGMELSPAEATQSKELGLFESVLEKSPRSADVVRDWQFKNQLDPLMKQRESVINSITSTPRDIDDVGRQIHKEVSNYISKHTNLRGKATERLRGRILGKIGSTESAEAVGMSTQEQLAFNTQRTMDLKNELYNKVGEYIPAGSFETTNLKRASENILKEMERIPPAQRNNKIMNYIEWGIGKKKMNPLLEEQLESVPPSVKEQILAQMEKESPELLATKRDWETLQLNRQELSALLQGENISLKHGAPGIKLQATPDGRRYNILKDALEKDMRQIAQSTGGDAWAALKAADAFYSSNVPKVFRHKIIRQLAYGNPSKLSEIAFKPRAVEEVRLIKQAVGREKFNELRSSWVNRLIGDEFNPNYLAKQLKRYGDDFLNESFSKNEVAFLKKVSQQGMRLDRVQFPNETFLKKIVSDYPDTVVDSLIGAPEAYKQSFTVLKNLRMIKKIVSKDSYKNIGVSFAEKVFKLQTNSNVISPEAFQRYVKKYSNRNVFRELYPKETVTKVKELGRVAEDIVGAQKLSANPSGTGQVGIAWGTLGMMISNPVKGTSILITPRIMARLMYSKQGMKYLTDGFKLPIGSKEGVENIVRLTGIINEQGAQ